MNKKYIGDAKSLKVSNIALAAMIIDKDDPLFNQKDFDELKFEDIDYLRAKDIDNLKNKQVRIRGYPYHVVHFKDSHSNDNH